MFGRQTDLMQPVQYRKISSIKVELLYSSKLGYFFMNPPYIIYISKKNFGGQSDRIFLSFSAERKNFVYFLFLFCREEFLRWIVRVQAAKNVKVGSTRMTIITSCVNENYKNWRNPEFKVSISHSIISILINSQKYVYVVGLV